ncbi:hypothetical protein AB832_03190 [Flavobacteriaceae bacterium (ex Bugula neritina AB1)]|nr:hypothetical protein AB832_03190 [Flavobacteriaceae bacterium (ex Bugula neritina AB1)]
MNTIKPHFEMHSRFRNGVFLLALILFLGILLFFFLPTYRYDVTNLKELTEYQHQIDSLKKAAIIKKKVNELRPFNPNFITEYKGYVLGLSTVELDRLYAYRKEGKWVNSIQDFKRVTQVSDSLLVVISPYFKFPEWTQYSKTPKRQKKKFPDVSFANKKDLNQVTASELTKGVGVPDFISERIIKYRKKLNGFIDDVQLQDVSGLYEYQRNKILSLYTVKTRKDVNKINVNTASVKELMEVPYFDFEMALSIRDFIKMNNGISNFTELEKVEGFSLEKIDRIALYLKFN